MKLQTSSGKTILDTGKLGERFKRAWDGLRLKEINEYDTATATSGFIIDPDENDYRRISQAKRDLPPVKQERAIELSYAFNEKDPLAQRLLRVPLEAIASAGVQFKAEDERIDELWQEWWECPLYPLWGFKARYYSNTSNSLWIDARVAGEAIWPFTTSPFEGKIDLAYIDPINVEQILMQPGNALIKDKIVLKRGLGFNDEQRVLQIVRPYPDLKTFLGNCFYFPRNAPVNSSRGRPELLAVLDWIGNNNEAMFSDAELHSMRSRLLYDVKVDGADQPTLLKMQQEYFPSGAAPKPGTAFFHNEKMEMNVQVPDLKNGDFVQGIQNQIGYIIAGRGLNKHLLGFSGDVNTQAIREMSMPAVWTIEGEQRFDVLVISTVFSCVVSKAIEKRRQLESGLMDDTVDRTFSLRLLPVFPRDTVMLTSTALQAQAFAESAEQSRYLSHKSAQAVVINAANQLGMELTQDSEQELIDEEEAEEEVQALLAPPPQTDLFAEQQGKDVTGMAGETMPQNRRILQQSYRPKKRARGKAKGYSRKTRKRLASSLMEE